jgi:hypothetical protein
VHEIPGNVAMNLLEELFTRGKRKVATLEARKVSIIIL